MIMIYHERNGDLISIGISRATYPVVVTFQCHDFPRFHRRKVIHNALMQVSDINGSEIHYARN